MKWPFEFSIAFVDIICKKIILARLIRFIRFYKSFVLRETF